MFAQLTALVAFVAPFAAAGPHAAHHGRQHHEIAQRMENSTHTLEKRFSNARWTFYDAGLGACGKTNDNSDFIVALNAAQFGGGYPGPNCFKKITMSFNGKTTQATIMDKCPGCPYGGLDLTPALFEFFADKDKGVIQGEWSFGGGGGGGDDDDDDDKGKDDDKDDEPKTSSKKEETKTTSSKKEEPTSSEKKTSTSSSSTSTSRSSSSAAKTSSSSSSIATPTSSSSTSTPTGGAIDHARQAVIEMAGIAAAGYSA